MRRLFLALFIAIAANQANAEPASGESVRQLLRLTKAEAMLDSMYATMEQVMQQSMQQATAGKPISPEQQKIIESVPGRLVSIMRTELAWDKLEPEYVRLYTETFDQSEVDGLVSFYQSAAGRAFVSKMPTVMQKAVAIGQIHMQVIAPRLRDAVNEALAEAKLAK